MFSKTRDASQLKDIIQTMDAATPAKGSRKKGVPSILSADLRINGDVTSDSPMHIEGQVQGDIRTPHLTVGAEAQVSGMIETDEARIDGTVNGQITATKVELSKTAKVVGDIVHEVLSIEAGAYVEGNFQRRQKSEAQTLTLRKTAKAAE